MTGTPFAYRPKGSLYGAGERRKATGDLRGLDPD